MFPKILSSMSSVNQKSVHANEPRNLIYFSRLHNLKIVLGFKPFLLSLPVVPITSRRPFSYLHSILPFIDCESSRESFLNDHQWNENVHATMVFIRSENLRNLLKLIEWMLASYVSSFGDLSLQ